MLICSAAQAAPPHRYEVSVEESLDTLVVRACFGGTAPDALVAASDGARFYLESMRLGERLLEPVGDKVILGAVSEDSCVEYRVKLQPAQSRVQTGGPETRRTGRDMLTSIGDWLWRPQELDADTELRFRLPSGVEVIELFISRNSRADLVSAVCSVGDRIQECTWMQIDNAVGASSPQKGMA